MLAIELSEIYAWAAIEVLDDDEKESDMGKIKRNIQIKYLIRIYFFIGMNIHYMEIIYLGAGLEN